MYLFYESTISNVSQQLPDVGRSAECSQTERTCCKMSRLLCALGYRTSTAEMECGMVPTRYEFNFKSVLGEFIVTKLGETMNSHMSVRNFFVTLILYDQFGSVLLNF